MMKFEVDRLTDASSTFLDLTRGISAQVVLFGHAISYLGVFNMLQPPSAPYMQNIAVAVFFYLSGYLISYSSIRKSLKPEYSFNDYFFERFARIYSAYFPAILFVVLIDALMISFFSDKYAFLSAFNFKHFFGNVFMLQDFPVYFKKLTSFGSARPFWTLAIEWWFYMAFGWIFLFKPKANLGWVFKGLILIPLLIVPWHNVFGRGNGLTFVWIAGALSPVVLSELKKHKFNQKLVSIILAFVLTTIATVIVLKSGSPKSWKFGLFMSGSFFAWLWHFQTSQYSVPAYLKKFATFIAGFSFTLYLLHYSLLDILFHAFGAELSPYLLLAIMFFLSNFLSIIVARFTEDKHKEFVGWLKTNISPPIQAFVAKNLKFL